MPNQVAGGESPGSAGRGASRLGFWAAVLTAVAAAAALALGVTTPPRSGPFCTGSCITYPYADAAAFVPRDYLWMYPAVLMAPLFFVVVACIHHYAAPHKRVFGQIALSFAVISATALTVDYFIQLAVMQPSLLKGEVEGLSLFSQYNPHGVFIALEDVGYLFMGVAFLFAAAALDRRERLQRATQFLFVTGAALAVGSLVVLALIYRSDLEYRYEVAAIVIDWVTLIVSGVLLSLVFRRRGRELRDEAVQ
jgi:hypothetical protein